MGNASAKKVRVVSSEPLSWGLEQVVALRERYVEGNYDFGVRLEELEEILRDVFGDASAAEMLWERFAAYEEVNALELFCALGLVSTASVDEKFRYVFEVVDFRNEGALHYDDICLALSLSVSGTCRFLGEEGRCEPERQVDLIFLKALKDTTASLRVNQLWHALETSILPALCLRHDLTHLKDPKDFITLFGDEAR